MIRQDIGNSPAEFTMPMKRKWDCGIICFLPMRESGNLSREKKDDSFSDPRKRY